MTIKNDDSHSVSDNAEVAMDHDESSSPSPLPATSMEHDDGAEQGAPEQDMTAESTTVTVPAEESNEEVTLDDDDTDALPVTEGLAGPCVDDECQERLDETDETSAMGEAQEDTPLQPASKSKCPTIQDIEAAIRESTENHDKRKESPTSKENSDTSISQTLSSEDPTTSLVCPVAIDDNVEPNKPTMGRVSIATTLWINSTRQLRQRPKRLALIVVSAVCLLVLLLVTVLVVALIGDTPTVVDDAPAGTTIIDSAVNGSSAASPSSSPSRTSNLPYVPGKLTVSEHQLLLSQGLSSKIIATSGMPVEYQLTNGETSSMDCHAAMDVGAIFKVESEEGGWIYVSNSAAEDNQGGVGGFTFDADGNLVDYKMLLTNTSNNRGDGRTPWNTYISCEERITGRCYQVDPTGQREAQMITVGEQTNGGKFGSFAAWTLYQTGPHFFVTEGGANGTVRRFIPDDPDWTDPWSILLGSGSSQYLLLEPWNTTFRWTSNLEEARSNAGENFPEADDLYQNEDRLYFTSKTLQRRFILDLLEKTYTEDLTEIGDFDGDSNQMARFETDADAAVSDTVYFTQDGGGNRGIAARDARGTYTVVDTVAHDDDNDKTTGLAFSVDGKHMYFVVHDALYDLTRNDGLSFFFKPPTIVYVSEPSS